MNLNYTEVVNILKRYIEDQDEDFLAVIDTIISLAETRIATDTKLETFSTTLSSASVDNVNGYFEMTGSLIGKIERVYDSTADVYLLPRAFDFVKEMFNKLPASSPKYYARYQSTRIYYAPAFASTTNQISVTTAAVAPHITSVNTTSFISNNMADLLVAALLVEAERYNKNVEMQSTREAEYQRVLASYAPYNANSQVRSVTPVETNPAPMPRGQLRPGTSL